MVIPGFVTTEFSNSWQPSTLISPGIAMRQMSGWPWGAMGPCCPQPASSHPFHPGNSYMQELETGTVPVPKLPLQAHLPLLSCSRPHKQSVQQQPQSPKTRARISTSNSVSYSMSTTMFYRTAVTEHVIETGEARPIRMAPYRVPHVYCRQVEEELEYMLAAGIVEPSTSNWAAPIVLVKKKDGTLRFCVAYRRPNSQSRVDPYPMPRVDDLIDKLGHARYLTTLM